MMSLYKTGVLLCTVLICATSSEAFMCMCSPNSCVLLHANSDFFENVESYCSTFRNMAQDISIVKLMDTHLSPVAFEKFPNMTSLEIFQGQLTEIGNSTFKNAKHLSKLLIKGNNISRLDAFAFDGADELKNLLISASPLGVVAESALDNLKHLDVLVLTHGELTSLPKRMFKNNRKLTFIALNGNKITFIDPEIFVGLDELVKLDLSFNQLATFESTFLKASFVSLHNNSLVHLTINEHCNTVLASNNMIQTINVEGTKLTKLELTNNQITDISNITKLANLTSLYLGYNPLLTNTVFGSLIALEELILQSTNINITADTFANLNNLRILDLSYNNLTEVDFTVFKSQMVLQILSFVGNKIQRFDYLLVSEYLPRLRVLEICKNGWNSTYFERNVRRMKQFHISPDIHGFASHVFFRDDYINICSDQAVDDYTYEDYPEPVNADIEDEIKLTFPNETEIIFTTTVATSTTKQAPTSTIAPSAAGSVDSQHHHIAEHDSTTVTISIQKQPASDSLEKASSPLHTTFQVLCYILSAVGLLSLIALAYLWTKRQSSVRRLIGRAENLDDVRLI